jgi:NADH-quinone oxidoreductase subunit G
MEAGMSKIINFTIDGRKVQAEKGESILQVARREGIYIPTMCYLAKTSPSASCRMCVVEVEGVDGFILSCNTPPTEGAAITTDSGPLYTERQNIMKMYNVNHPLQCGVCDKSGECDLQNKTLDFGLDQQSFAVVDQKRKKKKWGVLSYDPHLCIMCEKCASVCNEIVGAEALYIRPGGYKSMIDNHFNHCIQCGECISVCPVGAMASSDFKYSANAWELQRIPSACAHCSSACSLNYEVKQTGIDFVGQKSIYRVTNEADHDSLCGAGRFGYDFENRVESKDAEAFEKALEAFKKADTIRFNSMITNEEAMILQRLKEKHGYKLINKEAKAYRDFMGNFSSHSSKLLYSADLDSLKECDYAITIGSSVSSDNPMIRFALSKAVNRNKAYVAYMHPIEDEMIRNIVSQYVKYEVGSEEGVLAMICDMILSDETKAENKAFFDDLDIGYISGESSVGEEEFAQLAEKLSRKRKPVLVIGEDLINHERSANIAKMAGLIDRFSSFSVMIAPPATNSLGVSLICDLDSEAGSYAVGYNAEADFVLSALGEGDLDMPALNQQEGTFTNIDKKVVPLNAALPYYGYELNDIAAALDVKSKFVIDYTQQLPSDKGYKGVAFDDLENYYTNVGEQVRGYVLDNPDVETSGKLETLSDIPEFNGSVIYRCNPLSQFSPFTDKAHQIVDEPVLTGSQQFAVAARIKGGEHVTFVVDGRRVERKFEIDSKFKGTVALDPSFDSIENYDSYRYNQVKIERV